VALLAWPLDYINTLTWLLQTGGASGGGFLATHPGTQERIDALKT